MKYRDIKQPNYRHIGKYMPRKEAKGIVTGKATFLDDFSVPHMLHARTKRSPYPHAKIVKIDTSAAEALEGVHAVITNENMPRLAVLGYPVHRKFFEDKVCQVGEPVALVAAETIDIADAAVDLIKVEYEQLPAVFRADEALQEGAPLLYERFPNNEVAPTSNRMVRGGRSRKATPIRRLRKPILWLRTRSTSTRCRSRELRKRLP